MSDESPALAAFAANAPSSPGAAAAAMPGMELERLVFEDDLTHLRNRRFLFKYLKEELAARDLEPGPLSLCLIDLDKFKQINDTYGHLAGDGALVHVSEIFRATLPEGGLAARYAGDEFVIVLPHAEKDAARRHAEDVLRRVKESDFRVGEPPERLALSLSIGVSSYPEDSREARPLLDAADRALYASKRAGRGRVSAVGSLPAEAMAGERALDGFPCPTFVGRRTERERFGQILSLAGAAGGTRAELPAFVLVTGVAGSGKSRLLRSYFEQAEDQKAVSVLVKGIERDSLTPYAALSNVTRALLATADAGAITESLSASERTALSYLIPGVSGPQPETAAPDPESLAAAFAKIAGALAKNRSVAVFVDDLQWIDVSSLDVLFSAARADGLPFVLAATIREGLGGLPAGSEPRRDRIERLLGEARPNGPLRVRVELPPLAKTEIVSMIRAIFAGLEVPDEVAEVIVATSRGNPLFVEEILKNLVNQGRITRGKKGWVVGPVAADDVPSNLDEALRSGFREIDKETDAVLTNAAAIGPEFALKLVQDLTGKREAEVLELIDKAEAAKLLRYVGDLGVDSVEFSAPRLQELVSDATREPDARAIHERIARFEETENRGAVRGVLGRLAFHHARAGHAAEAKDLLARIAAVGGAEAASAGEMTLLQPHRLARRRVAAADSSLSAREIALVGTVVRHLAAVIKSRLIYPKGSKLIASAIQDLGGSLERAFRTIRVFTVGASDKDLFINGNKIDPRRATVGMIDFQELLKKYDIKSVTMTSDVAPREIEAFVDALCDARPYPLPPDFWDQWLDEASVRNLAIDQRVYVLAGSEAATAAPASADGTAARPARAEGRLEIGDDLKAVLPALLDRLVREKRDSELGETIERLLAGLASNSVERRRECARFLRDAGKSFIGPARLAIDRRLAPALESRLAVEEDPEALRDVLKLSCDAIRAAIERGDLEAATGVVRAVAERRNAWSPDVEREATRALKEILESSAFEVLLSDLGSGVAERHDRAFQTLSAFGPSAIGALVRVLRERDDYRLRKTGARVLKAFGSAATDGVRAALQGSIPDVELRRLISVLDDVPGDFAREIEKAFQHPNRGVRNEAVTLLNRLRSDIHRVFLAALKSPDPQIAAEAAREVGKRGRPEDAPALLSRLKAASDPELLTEILLALGRIGDAESEAALIAVAARKKLLFFGPYHPDKVRASAAWALSRLATPRAKAACEALARDRSPQVRAMLTSPAAPEPAPATEEPASAGGE